MLVILVVILVALILHRVHLRLSGIKDSNPSRGGEIPTSHSGRVYTENSAYRTAAITVPCPPPTRTPLVSPREGPSPASYDDILSVPTTHDNIHSFPDSGQEDSIQNGGDTDIITTCNEAYGVAPDTRNSWPLEAPSTLNTEHNNAECGQRVATPKPTRVVYENIDTVDDSLETNDAYNDLRDGWLMTDTGVNVGGIQELEDDGPDYENLVSPDHLFGDYVQPDFATTPNSSKVQCTFKNVVYSELKGYPYSGKMASSRSLPNIPDHCREGNKPSKQKNWQKADQVKITLPVQHMY